jgi:hypothetical protein
MAAKVSGFLLEPDPSYAQSRKQHDVLAADGGFMAL